MVKFIRNDDVAADTTLDEIRSFCELCDKYGLSPIHAITPIGNARPVSVAMDNAMIRKMSGTALFSENRAVVDYLRSRNDQFAVHGLWHTHEPSAAETEAAWVLIRAAGIDAKYYVPPFNEGPGEGIQQWAGLKVLGANVPRLESFLDTGEPAGPIAYLHSWRFETGWGNYSWGRLDRCFERLTAPQSSGATRPLTTGSSIS